MFLKQERPERNDFERKNKTLAVKEKIVVLYNQKVLIKKNLSLIFLKQKSVRKTTKRHIKSFLNHRMPLCLQSWTHESFTKNRIIDQIKYRIYNYRMHLYWHFTYNDL